MPRYDAFVDGEIEYEAVPASATDQQIGPVGGVGNYLSHIIVAPTSAAPGTITIKDGATTILVLTPTTSSQPFTQFIGLMSVVGAWSISTGANVTLVAAGNFT